MTSKLTAEHVARSAIVYVRQSSPGQVQDHPESRRRQYALADVACDLGFHNIETIDQDLGRSGSGFAQRPGFQRMLAQVCAGQVGAVLALEASRLARNDPDWAGLMQIAAISNTMIIDHDGVYDPRAINDRLLLGLKGLMSEFESATLRQRAYEAVRAKAARGELWMHLPVGLVHGDDGGIELDPDIRVQQAVRLLLRKFDELGSSRQVMLWFRQQKIELPRVRRTKRSSPQIEWRLPRYHQVHSIVTNPFYAGAFVFGRSESRTTIVDGKAHKTAGHRKPTDQWQVLIRDHHPGYIDWRQFERNMARISENTFMQPAAGRKAARGGRSLLAGLLRCRRCGYTLVVSYRGMDSKTPSYRCRRAHHDNGAEWCIHFSGRRIEDAISTQILNAVQGEAVQAALQAAREAGQQREQLRTVRALELEQARYEAKLAARRYEQVDPDQRLVAAELEARWNTALQHVAELEQDLQLFDSQRQRCQPIDERKLLALAADLPVLWNDEATDMRLKQRIARILIREVVADVDEGSNEVVLIIHWEGGRHTELRVSKSLSGRTQRCAGEQAEALVRQMASRWSDHAIASTLNRVGYRTGTGQCWNRSRLRALRSRLELPPFDPQRRQDDMLTIRDAANRLGISAASVQRLIERGILPATQIVARAPWRIEADALDSAPVRQAVCALKARPHRPRPENLSNKTLKIPGL